MSEKNSRRSSLKSKPSKSSSSSSSSSKSSSRRNKSTSASSAKSLSNKSISKTNSRTSSSNTSSSRTSRTRTISKNSYHASVSSNSSSEEETIAHKSQRQSVEYIKMRRSMRPDVYEHSSIWHYFIFKARLKHVCFYLVVCFILFYLKVPCITMLNPEWKNSTRIISITSRSPEPRPNGNIWPKW